MEPNNKLFRFLPKNGDRKCHSRGLDGVFGKTAEDGFSLIELLLVVVIIGVIAALAVPALQKGVRSAENGTTFATLRTIGSTQVNFFSSKGRFGRLSEINQALGGGIGGQAGERVVRGRYVFEMNPAIPTDTELKSQYVITATRSVSDDVVYKYEVNQTGQIKQILP